MIRALSLGSLAVVALASGASAGDLIIPTTPQTIYQDAGFDWSGAYVGLLGGAAFDDAATYGVAGGFVGYNFIVADPILLGLEFTGSYDWTEDYHSTKLLGAARLGAIVTDSVLVYALAGAGLYATTLPGDDNGYAYQIGGGIEVAVTNAITVRGELVGIGVFDDGNDDAFDSARATVGLAYHF